MAIQHGQPEVGGSQGCHTQREGRQKDYCHPGRQLSLDLPGDLCREDSSTAEPAEPVQVHSDPRGQASFGRGAGCLGGRTRLDVSQNHEQEQALSRHTLTRQPCSPSKGFLLLSPHYPPSQTLLRNLNLRLQVKPD